MFQITDEVVSALFKQITRRFKAFTSKYLGTAAFDELNILKPKQFTQSELLKAAQELYNTLDYEARYELLLLAQAIYKKQGGNEGTIAAMWLSGLLEEYDPVTKYVYAHEVDRKEARFAESIIASNNLKEKKEESKTAQRLWAGMVKQYADTVTTRAVLEAWKEQGVEKVRWVTVHDERRCKECRKRDNRVYDIDKVPSRPHWGCRCRLVPYRRGGAANG